MVLGRKGDYGRSGRTGMTQQVEFRVRWWHYLKFVPWTALFATIALGVFLLTVWRESWDRFLDTERELWQERHGRE